MYDRIFLCYKRWKSGEMNRIDYSKLTQEIIDRHRGDEHPPTLLLHSCCAPCSSYVIEYLSEF